MSRRADRYRAVGRKMTRAGISDRLKLMLHAAVIGFPSTGKSTLFQLMTSVEAARAKGEVSIGISKVPDERLDRLTAMYNPKKRVPATSTATSG